MLNTSFKAFGSRFSNRSYLCFTFVDVLLLFYNLRINIFTQGNLREDKNKLSVFLTFPLGCMCLTRAGLQQAWIVSSSRQLKKKLEICHTAKEYDFKNHLGYLCFWALYLLEVVQAGIRLPMDEIREAFEDNIAEGKGRREKGKRRH